MHDSFLKTVAPRLDHSAPNQTDNNESEATNRQTSQSAAAAASSTASTNANHDDCGDCDDLQRCGQILENEDAWPIDVRYSAVFRCRNEAQRVPEAVTILSRAMRSKSTLIAHESAYALGQMQHAGAIEQLIDVLNDSSLNSIVRHEAGEALGAIGIASHAVKKALKHNMLFSNIPEVSETCLLALHRLKMLEWQSTGVPSEVSMNQDSEESKDSYNIQAACNRVSDSASGEAKLNDIEGSVLSDTSTYRPADENQLAAINATNRYNCNNKDDNDETINADTKCTISAANVNPDNEQEEDFVKQSNVIVSRNESIDFTNEQYRSIDPTPASKETDVAKLYATLYDQQAALPLRYQSLFALRNINDPAVVELLANALLFDYELFSSLLLHEIAFVLGEMAMENAVEPLAAALANKKLHPMVRHEAAESLGAISTKEAIEALKNFITDEEEVVRESVSVALHHNEYL